MLNNAARALTAIALGGVFSLAAIPLTAVPAHADTGVDVPMASPSIAVAFSPDSALAYVSGGNNLIKVLDASTHGIIDTIALPGVVSSIAMSPDGATLYAVDGANNNVYAVDTSTRAIGAPIPAGASAGSVVITHDGAFVYVGNMVGRSVTVIDTSTNLVVDTIALPFRPAKLKMAPDGSIVWALSFTSPDTVMIDTTTHATTTFTPDSNPATVAVLDVIYAASNTELDFLTSDGATSAVFMYFLPGLTPGGTLVGLPVGMFMAGAVDATQDILWLIDMGSATINSFPGGATATVGAMPWSIAVRPDGLAVWVPTTDGQSVTIFTRPYTGSEPNTSLPGAFGDTVTIDSAVPAGTYDTLRWQYYDFGLATWQDLPGKTGTTLDVVLNATSASYRYRLVATSAVFGEVPSGQWAVGSPVADATGASATLAISGADGVRTTGGIVVALVLAGLAFMGVRRSRRP